MKDLPSLVQRQLSRALVIAGSAIEHDSSRKQYLSQVRHFQATWSKPVFMRERSVLERCLPEAVPFVEIYLQWMEISI